MVVRFSSTLILSQKKKMKKFKVALVIATPDDDEMCTLLMYDLLTYLEGIPGLECEPIFLTNYLIPYLPESSDEPKWWPQWPATSPIKLMQQFRDCDGLMFFFADTTRESFQDTTTEFRGSKLIEDALASVACEPHVPSNIELKPVHVVSIYPPKPLLDTVTYLRRKIRRQSAVPLSRDICFNLEDQRSDDRLKNFCAEKSFKEVSVAIKELKFWRRLLWQDPVIHLLAFYQINSNEDNSCGKRCYTSRPGRTY